MAISRSTQWGQFRAYIVTVQARCTGCANMGPMRKSRTEAAKGVELKGWQVSPCFLCPDCQSRREARKRMALKKGGP